MKAATHRQLGLQLILMATGPPALAPPNLPRVNAHRPSPGLQTGQVEGAEHSSKFRRPTVPVLLPLDSRVVRWLRGTTELATSLMNVLTSSPLLTRAPLPAQRAR